jgi:hypothetical protein
MASLAEPRRPRPSRPARPEASEVALRAVLIGSVANLCVVAALGTLGRREGRSALAPINATSHVLHGDRAGRVDRLDASHTGVGALVNHGAAIFWALPFTWWLAQGRDRPAAQIAAGAAATAAVAGAVDYGLIPRRLTPGWELVLPPRGVVATFGALALGLAVGAVATRGLGRRN